MSDFFWILFASEIKALSGSSFRTIFALVAILLFTVLALGLAYGTLDNLRKRMDNPYTNWVDVPITPSVESKVSSILSYYEDAGNRSQYNLENVTRYDIFYAKFLHVNSIDTFQLRGRTVEPDDRILQSVFEEIKGNVLVKHASLDEFPCGIVVTMDFLKTLGYDKDGLTVRKIYMPYEDEVVLLDILAVVRELPSLCDFLSSPIFPNMRNLPNYKTHFIESSISSVVPVRVEEKLSDEDINSWQRSAETLGLKSIAKGNPLEIRSGHVEMIYRLNFLIDSLPSALTLNKVLSFCPGDRRAVLFRETYCNDNFSGMDIPDHLAFQFNSLEKVRKFKDGMLKDFELTVSMQQVESAENFSLVSTLTLTTSLVLFGFSMLSIGFYISSLVRAHLQHISANLGTMKAFGLGNALLVKVYIGIIGLFCLGASGISLLLAILIQEGLHYVSPGVYIDVLNARVIAALTIIMVLCLFLAYKSTTSLLRFTPGDLVYRRNN